MFKITSFDDSGLKGTSSTRGVAQLFIGPKLVAKTPLKELGEKRFEFDFANTWGEIPGGVEITVRLNNSLAMPEITERVIGFLPRKVDLDQRMRDYFHALKPLPEVPQHLLDYIGSGAAGQSGYRGIGFHYFQLLTRLLGAPRETKMLEIGCGAGRIGAGLGPHLAAGGAYLGLDTWAEGVDWAHRNITPLYRRVRFASLPSPPQGHRAGYLADYAAPIPTRGAPYDLIIATSLFTHLKRGSAADYLRQMHGLLRPNGIAFITAFIIEPEDRAWVMNKYGNNADDFAIYTEDDTYVDAYIELAAMRAIIAESGLTLCRFIPGSWPGEEARPMKSKALNPQDILILKKL